MSPAGIHWCNVARLWMIGGTKGMMDYYIPAEQYHLRPVINLNSNVTATGTGTSSDPYVIQTN